MANKQPATITTNVLAKALYEKSKRTFSHRKSEIWHQANYFSPVYRDFIYKIITNPSLKIYASKNDESYIQNDPKEVPNNKLTRKFHNFIYFDVLNKTSLPHELGHAVDFWFGAGTPLTSVVILEDNKTLYDIFTEEFESNYQSIYNLIMDEYKNIID